MHGKIASAPRRIFRGSRASGLWEDLGFKVNGYSFFLRVFGTELRYFWAEGSEEFVCRVRLSKGLCKGDLFWMTVSGSLSS